MGGVKIYENAYERQRAAYKRRREREGWAAKEKPAPKAKRAPVVCDAIELYRAEKVAHARRMRRIMDDAKRALEEQQNKAYGLTVGRKRKIRAVRVDPADALIVALGRQEQ